MRKGAPSAYRRCSVLLTAPSRDLLLAWHRAEVLHGLGAYVNERARGARLHALRSTFPACATPP
eukprot:scaffold197143_cov27-Tisochrysis_lutea.AAC.2